MTKAPDLALLSAGEAAPGAVPPGLFRVAGRTIVERQARQVLRAGAREVVLLGCDGDAFLARRLSRLGPVTLLPAGARLSARLADADQLLVVEPGTILDERILDAVAASPDGPALAVWSLSPPDGAERIDSVRHWASVARLPGRDAAAALTANPSWEPAATLMRTAAAAGAQVVEVGEIPLYAEGRRREVPILWARPATADGIARVEKDILAAAQKGCLDWPARFLHPPVENLLVRLLWPTAVTPNMVTGLTAILGLAAGLLILAGQLGWALALILLIGPLDGVDGKLARTRIEFSRYGDLEHVLDKVMEYGWFLGLAAWFAHQGHGLAAWLAGLGIILFALVEAGQGEWFRRITGRQLDDWGPFERRFRLVGGRRNTFFWSLLPFAAFDQWWPGLVMILGYAFLTWAVHEWRFLLALTGYLRAEAPAVRRNLDRTAYAFLPKSADGSS
jgi:phosphatidylglycerophosphate synthase